MSHVFGHFEGHAVFPDASQAAFEPSFSQSLFLAIFDPPPHSLPATLWEGSMGLRLCACSLLICTLGLGRDAREYLHSPEAPLQ
jgi:hypothetical protein